MNPTAAPVACTRPLGPGGEAVSDQFSFLHRTLDGNGAITVRVTSMSGSSQWSKAGIILKASTRPGSAYAAMLVTPGHGVRMQWNYTGDAPGLAGRASADAPRWLRLSRNGGTVVGQDSNDGVHWTTVDTETVTGLPSRVLAGMFATSPGSSTTTSQSVTGSSARGGVGLGTGVFDHVTVQGGRPAGAWTGTAVGGSGEVSNVGFHRSAGTYTVKGTGDIAPDVGDSIAETLVGTFAGLIAVIVIGAMFIGAEYRRGLIRTTLAASPRRGRVLAAKAVVVGSAAFVAGLPAAYVALLVGERNLRAEGSFVDPVSALTEVRVIVGTAALLGVAAVAALGIAAVLRRGAAAVTTAIVVIFLPYLFVMLPTVLPAGVQNWLLRVTPWAGFAVLCAWAALALGLAAYLMRRRDA
jgi:hypothetical protein